MVELVVGNKIKNILSWLGVEVVGSDLGVLRMTEDNGVKCFKLVESLEDLVKHESIIEDGAIFSYLKYNEQMVEKLVDLLLNKTNTTKIFKMLNLDAFVKEPNNISLIVSKDSALLLASHSVIKTEYTLKCLDSKVWELKGEGKTLYDIMYDIIEVCKITCGVNNEKDGLKNKVGKIKRSYKSCYTWFANNKIGKYCIVIFTILYKIVVVALTFCLAMLLSWSFIIGLIFVFNEIMSKLT